jgi:hypothetical protein
MSMRAFGILSFILIVIVSIVGSKGGGPHQYNQYDAKYEAERAVRAYLFDPWSADFKSVEMTKDKDQWKVYGLVNAKNRFGGYVGYKYFTYYSSTKNLNIED